MIWGNLNIAPTLCVPSTFFSIGKGDSNSLFISFQPPLCLPSWVQAGDRWEDEDSVSLVVPGDSHLSHFSRPRQAQTMPRNPKARWLPPRFGAHQPRSEPHPRSPDLDSPTLSSPTARGLPPACLRPLNPGRKSSRLPCQRIAPVTPLPESLPWWPLQKHFPANLPTSLDPSSTQTKR